MVELTVSAGSGYETVVETKTITIEKGEQGAPAWQSPTYGVLNWTLEDNKLLLNKTYNLRLTPRGGGGHGRLDYFMAFRSRDNCSIDSETGAITVNSLAGTSYCSPTVRWLGNDDYESSEYATSAYVQITRGIMTVENWGNWDYARVNGLSSGPPTITGLVPSDAAFSYQLVGNPTACTFDTQSNEVTGVAATSSDTDCQVKLTLTHRSYATKTYTYTVDVLAANEIGVGSWGSYGTTVNLHESLSVNAPGLQRVDPADVAKNYVVAQSSSSVCSISDATNGAATLLGVGGACEITLTLSKASHSSKSHTYTFNVNVIPITVSGWGNYSNWIRTGGNASAPSLTGVSQPGTSSTYTTGTGSSGCSVNGVTGEVTGTGSGGTCKVVRSVNKSGYGSATHTYTITVYPTTAIVVDNWGTYGTVRITQQTDAPALTGVYPSGGVNKNYTTSTSSTCTVNRTSGRVRGTGVGPCSITLTLSKTSYTNKSHTYTFNVQKLAMPGPLVAPVYTGPLRFGAGALSISTQPSGAPGGSNWTYSVQGKRGVYNFSRACSINTSNGDLSLGSAAQPGDSCVITARANHTSYISKNAPTVTVNIAQGVINVTDWGTWDAIGNHITCTTLEPVPPPAISSTPATTDLDVTWNTDSTDCYFDGDGNLKSSAEGTDNCVVDVELSKQYFGTVTHTYTLSVQAKGEIRAASWGRIPDMNRGSGGYSVNINDVITLDIAYPTSGVQKSYTDPYPGNLNACQGCNVVNSNGSFTTMASKGISGNPCEITVTLSKQCYEDLTHTYSVGIANPLTSPTTDGACSHCKGESSLWRSTVGACTN